MGRDKEIKNTEEEGTNQPVNITVLQICNTVHMFSKFSPMFVFLRLLHVVLKVKAISFNRTDL